EFVIIVEPQVGHPVAAEQLRDGLRDGGLAAPRVSYDADDERGPSVRVPASVRTAHDVIPLGGRHLPPAGPTANSIFFHLHSSQFTPVPVATTSGTRRSIAPSIRSRTSAIVASASSAGASKRSSSCTCRSIF